MGTLSLDAVPHLVKLSRDDAYHQQQAVADLLHRQSIGFPGAQPVSFKASHLEELTRTDYFVAEKTDGIRLLLYLTSLPNDEGGSSEAQFLIDRRNDYHYVGTNWIHIPLPNLEYVSKRKGPPYLDNGWHVGTILDGELVRQKWSNGKEHLTFLIFDCLAMDGEDVTQRPFDSRIGKINYLMDAYKQFAKDHPHVARDQPFQLDLKKPELGYTAPVLFRDRIPNLPHGNDGLIYTCKATPYKSGTDPHILKWKPPKENTIDFRLQINSFPMKTDELGNYEDFNAKPDIELLIHHSDKDYRPFRGGTKLHLTDEEWEAIKRMGQQIDWRIIECWREKETGHWRPKIEPDGTPRYRDDKAHANHVTIAESVLESIEDAVSKEDLINAYDTIRNAWKAREAAAKKSKEAAVREKQRQNSTSHAMEEDDGPRYAD